jgi:hypothetical protein
MIDDETKKHQWALKYQEKDLHLNNKEEDEEEIEEKEDDEEKLLCILL